MYLVINKWVTAVKVSNFSGHFLRNRSTLDTGVLGYIGIVWPKEHSPEVSHIPPVTPCIVRRMRNTSWITKVTNIHTEYVTLTVFPLQQWLHVGENIMNKIHHTILKFVLLGIYVFLDLINAGKMQYMNIFKSSFEERKTRKSLRGMR